MAADYQKRTAARVMAARLISLEVVERAYRRVRDQVEMTREGSC